MSFSLTRRQALAGLAASLPLAGCADGSVLAPVVPAADAMVPSPSLNPAQICQINPSFQRHLFLS